MSRSLWDMCLVSSADVTHTFTIAMVKSCNTFVSVLQCLADAWLLHDLWTCGTSQVMHSWQLQLPQGFLIVVFEMSSIRGIRGMWYEARLGSSHVWSARSGVRNVNQLISGVRAGCWRSGCWNDFWVRMSSADWPEVFCFVSWLCLIACLLEKKNNKKTNTHTNETQRGNTLYYIQYIYLNFNHG